MRTKDLQPGDGREIKFASSISELIRRGIVLTFLVLGIAGVIFIFWKQEMKYSLPTPVPQQYAPVAQGQKVNLPSSLQKGRGYFLHFYNSECPCSRFNAKHIRSLIWNYSDSIEFIIVVAEASSLEKAKREFGDELHYVQDRNSEIAKACGVYSTPQAALVTNSGTLYYRGNYNAARYCTARASNFAELSLVALINKQPAPVFGIDATQSYGCELTQTQIEFF